MTPERQKLVDFSDPTRTNVSEILATAPGAPQAASVDDLSGRRVFVRKSTSYYHSLLALNAELKAKSKEPVIIEAAPGKGSRAPPRGGQLLLQSEPMLRSSPV